MKPKYNLGDKVWVLNTINKKAEERTVTGIRIAQIGSQHDCPTGFYYGFNKQAYYLNDLFFSESEVFPSREELIAAI